MPIRFAAAIVGALLLLPTAALAADWPTKPVRMIVPFAAGGAADAAGRAYAEALSAAFGQQFVVENRTGGGGMPAAEAVARAEPDGYTLLVSGTPNLVLQPAMNTNVGYDPMRDFTHIAYFGGTPTCWSCIPRSACRTYAGFPANACARSRAASNMCRPASAPWAIGSAEYVAAGRTSSSTTSPTRAARWRCSICSPVMSRSGC